MFRFCSFLVLQFFISISLNAIILCRISLCERGIQNSQVAHTHEMLLCNIPSWKANGIIFKLTPFMHQPRTFVCQACWCLVGISRILGHMINHSFWKRFKLWLGGKKFINTAVFFFPFPTLPEEPRNLIPFKLSSVLLSIKAFLLHAGVSNRQN